MNNTQVQPAQPRQLTIRDRLESDTFKSAVAKALPKHLTPDRFIRVACTAIMRTPKLEQCDQVSFFNALLTLSQLGIEPDGRRAHLIPFENRKRNVTEVQLIIDYKGLVELVMRSGLVSNIHADIVCDRDDFEFDRGELKKHKINFREPRGTVYAVYCLVRFKDGSEKCDVMTTSEVEAVRSRSRAGQAGPWVTDWAEMGKKTVFRRLSKWLQLSPEFRDAIEADEDTTIDIAPSQPFEIDPPKTKPRLGRPPKEEKPEAQMANPNPPPENIAAIEAQAAVGDAKATESEPSDNDGDLGPEKPEPTTFKVSEDLSTQLYGIGVSLEDFEKWVIETSKPNLADPSSRYMKFQTDYEKASAELLADKRALQKLQLRYGKA